MAFWSHRLGHPCTAAAAFPLGDSLLVAAATAEHGVTILQRRAGSGKLEALEAELEGHDAPVSGLYFAATGGADGAGPTLRLVSASHDRNSLVFTLQPATAGDSSGGGAASGTSRRQQQPPQQPEKQQRWQPELVVTKLRLAGLCAAWAPHAPKFALGSSDRSVAVCYYDARRELWAPRLIKKKHESSVMAVAWHPSGAVLATASTDGRLRVFNAVVAGEGRDVDGAPALPALAGSRFGDCLLELPLPGGWGLAAAFSPDGGCLAVASQASQVTLLSGIDLQAAGNLDAAAAAAAPGRLQHLQLPCLPLKCLAFLTDSLLAGGGFDCRPVLCTRQADGQWRHAGSLQGEASIKAGGAKSASLSARVRMFEAAAAAAAASGGGKAAAASGKGAARGGGGGGSSGSGEQQQQSGPHQNCIVSITALPPPAPGSALASFVTASLEGCVAGWEVDPASLA